MLTLKQMSVVEFHSKDSSLQTDFPFLFTYFDEYRLKLISVHLSALYICYILVHVQYCDIEISYEQEVTLVRYH